MFKAFYEGMDLDCVEIIGYENGKCHILVDGYPGESYYIEEEKIEIVNCND